MGSRLRGNDGMESRRRVTEILHGPEGRTAHSHLQPLIASSRVSPIATHPGRSGSTTPRGRLLAGMTEVVDFV